MPRTPCSLRFPSFLLLALAIVTVPQTEAQIVGFTAAQDTIFGLDLTSPEDFPTELNNWSFPSLSPINGLERDSQGHFYVVAGDAIGPQVLYRADPSTETFEELEMLGAVGPADLAFDDDGLLWILAEDGSLFSYDPAQEILALAATVTAGRPAGLAFYAGQLYALLTTQGDLGAEPRFGVIDTDTGAFSTLRDLPALPMSAAVREFRSLDFDDSGGLWVGYVEAFAVIDPPLLQAGAAYFPNPLEDSGPILDRLVDDDFRTEMPLVVTGEIATVEVPVLSRTGLLALVALLSGFGLATLRR